MRKSIVLLAACALVLLLFASTAWSGSVAARPFKGAIVGQVVFVPGTGEDLSPSPSGLWTVSSGCGDVSHMGETSFASRHPTPVTDAIAGGELTLTADNGDRVYATYEGTAPFPVIGVPSTIVAHTPFVIVGGTGRFAAASGAGDMVAYVAFPGALTPGPWAAAWVWRGTITY